jgi:urease accessory protein
MTTGMTARAVVETEADGDGVTRLGRLRSDGPLALRQVGAGGGTPDRLAETAGRSALTVYLVGAAAGPLAGDSFVLDVTVGAGSALVIRSTAAMLCLPGRVRSLPGDARTGASESGSPNGDSGNEDSGSGPSSELIVRATLGAGAALAFLPESTIAAAGCNHHARIEITAAADSQLAWREQIVLGRHGERPGRYVSRMDVEYAGVPLLRQELTAGDPVTDGSPAVLRGASAVGCTLLAGQAPTRQVPGGPPGTEEGTRGATGPANGGLSGNRVAPNTWPSTSVAEDGLAVLPLDGPGVLVSALAEDSVTLLRRLHRGEALARQCCRK